VAGDERERTRNSGERRERHIHLATFFATMEYFGYGQALLSVLYVVLLNIKLLCVIVQ